MNHIKYLKSLGACSEGIRYAARFPTLQDAWDACDNLADMKWLLKAPHVAAYRAAIAPHLAAYEAACAPHWAAYLAACDAHPATYAAARATYRAAIAPHRATYDAACAPHQAAYLAAIAPHVAAYRAARDACAAIDACNTCDELREQFACPAVPGHTS